MLVIRFNYYFLKLLFLTFYIYHFANIPLFHKTPTLICSIKSITIEADDVDLNGERPVPRKKFH